MEHILVTTLLILLGIGIGWVACLATYKFIRPVHDFEDEVMDSARNMVLQIERQAISGEEKLVQAIRAVTNIHPTAKLHDVIMRIVAAVDELKRK
jgi:hypothetical protein